MEPQAQESPVQKRAAPEHQAASPQPPAGRHKPAAKTRGHYQRRKAFLLPQITQLALAGQTGRAIALKFKKNSSRSLASLKARARTCQRTTGIVRITPSRAKARPNKASQRKLAPDFC